MVPSGSRMAQAVRMLLVAGLFFVEFGKAVRETSDSRKTDLELTAKGREVIHETDGDISTKQDDIWDDDEVGLALGSFSWMNDDEEWDLEEVGQEEAEGCETLCEAEDGDCVADQLCRFPFSYQGNQYNVCIKKGNENGKPWCETSAGWGMCKKTCDRYPQDQGAQAEAVGEEAALRDGTEPGAPGAVHLEQLCELADPRDMRKALEKLQECLKSLDEFEGKIRREHRISAKANKDYSDKYREAHEALAKLRNFEDIEDAFRDSTKGALDDITKAMQGLKSDIQAMARPT
eukprot:gnl/TRDRNA2_/TRDRNA2_174381_c0_seq1.p1 gnl/TRDRNA2_/TRDRNA2_174381_c0~~gnl/TRDRNA2_/TRDRNA2_174381_c0_seq1.p1  ORF type:complete len:290 (+),score=75.54 gnl/TRDRNA2_/TRDRNA2_174381_c0_seq1:104-973(+)